jgi:ubiquinol-cytochrome c reductase cytochrome b subunit
MSEIAAPGSPRSRIARALLFSALIVCALQALSGLALALHYVPSVEHAYDSVRVLEREVPLGRFNRALHYHGTSALIALLGLYLLWQLAQGAYRGPHAARWLAATALLVLVLAFGFTGYLLPWDQQAYFATVIHTEIAGKAPLVGGAAQAMLEGGQGVGPPTLTRFYVVHALVLPAALALLVAVCFLRRPRRTPGDAPPPLLPASLAEAGAGVLITALLFTVAAAWDAPLAAMAEPGEAGFQARPEWYYLGLFQLLKLTRGPLEVIGAFWLPGLLLAALLLLPFLDRSSRRPWRRRPIALSLAALLAIAGISLTVAGAQDAPANPPSLRHPLGLTDNERDGYLLVRRLECVTCHAYTDPQTKVTIGGSKDHPDAPYLDELGQDPEDVAAVLEAPAEVLGEETEMPAYDHVPYEQRRAIGLYLLTLQR